jgi:predicted metal-dependent peptidase
MTFILDADTTLEEALEEVNDRIRKAKLSLMLDTSTVFFCSLLANLKLIIDEGCKTAATDGVHLWFAPSYVLKWDGPHMLGLLLHEVMHVALQHMSRRTLQNLDARIWNYACDYYIDMYLSSLGYQVPDALIEHKFVGLSALQIYDELLKDPPPKQENFRLDLVLIGDKGDLSESEKDELEEIAITNVSKAIIQADMAGKPGSVPADIRQLLEERMNPKLPWEAIFQNHLSPHAKDDYSWARPNRRFMPDLYMPVMKSDALNAIFFSRDVSGSMTIPWLEAITCEMQYVWDVLKPIELRVTDFDTEIHRDTRHAIGDEFDPLELFGGGGTDVTPIIEMIRAESPEIAVIFSDGDFDMPDLSNLYTDLIWIIVDHPAFTAPFGTVIHFDTSE